VKDVNEGLIFCQSEEKCNYFLLKWRKCRTFV